MALKKDSIVKMLKALRFDDTKITELMDSADEKDAELPADVNILTKAELETRDRNTYSSAKKAGEEMLMKDLKKKHGIELQGEDPEKVIEALQAKIKKELDANPDARVAEMEKTVSTLKAAVKSANERGDRLEKEKNTVILDTKLLSAFPADRLDTMTNDELLTLVKSKIRVEVRDGKEVVLKDGQPVLDVKTMEPVPVTDAIKGYFTERNWIKQAAPAPAPGGGRGGGNSAPGAGAGTYAKLSEVNAKLEAEGISPNGERGQAFLAAAVKDNPGIDLKS